MFLVQMRSKSLGVSRKRDKCVGSSRTNRVSMNFKKLEEIRKRAEKALKPSTQFGPNKNWS